MNFFTKNRILIGGALLLTIINLAVLGTIGFNKMAGKSTADEMPSREKHLKMIAKELNLSPNQEEIFKELRQEYAQANHNIRRRIRELHKTSMKELGADTPSKAKLDSIAHAIGMLHVEQQQVTTQHFLKLREVCSPEQYQQLQQIFKRMMSREHMNRREMMHRKQRAERIDAMKTPEDECN